MQCNTQQTQILITIGTEDSTAGHPTQTAV